MSVPIEDLTPRQIVAELDRYIVGQAKAKRAVAVALRNRYRRQQLPPEQRDEIIPKNILMIGPTGVGKTEIARRLAFIARAPFIKVEATKFTEVGYVGRDVDSMVRDLASAAYRLVEAEKIAEARPVAEKRAFDRLLDLLSPQKASRRSRALATPPLFMGITPAMPEEPEESLPEDRRKQRARLRDQLKKGELDGEMVSVEVDDPSMPFVQVFTPQGFEEMGMDMYPNFGSMGRQRVQRRVTVLEAKRLLADEEARALIDTAQLHREAVERAEQSGIIFLDELDKIAGREKGGGPDVSREGVQRDLLPIIEGSSVMTKYGPVRTDHILFIAAGAFHVSRPSELIPELQGRLPIRVELDDLSEDDFIKILTEPQNALTKQYTQLLSAEQVDLHLTREAIEELAAVAHRVNQQTENIGARRLHTLMERLLEDVLFDAPDLEDKIVEVDVTFVKRKLAGLAANVDVSRYIL